MEGQQQGNPNDSFGQDSQLLDGQEAILDIWWSQACNIEEMAGEQGFVTGASLPDQQGNEVMGVDDMNLSLNGEGGGDDLVQWNLERIFDIVSKKLIEVMLMYLFELLVVKYYKQFNCIGSQRLQGRRQWIIYASSSVSISSPFGSGTTTTTTGSAATSPILWGTTRL